jgi:hypothetical protein
MSTIALPDTLLLLRAIERAGEENPGPGEDDHYEYSGPQGTAHAETIAAHLGWVYVGDWRTDGHYEGEFSPDRIRAACKRLMRTELVFEYRPKHGRVHYGVAPEGEWALEAEDLPELPESPQHRRWRDVRETATRRLPTIRDELLGAVEAVRGNVEVGDWHALLAEREPDNMPRRTNWTPTDAYLAHHNLGTVVEIHVEELIDALKDLEKEEPK